MEFALNRENIRTHASFANRENEYYCPICCGRVIPRRGEINISHFAHVAKCIDSWNYDMSAWHSEWQNQFPEKTAKSLLKTTGRSIEQM